MAQVSPFRTAEELKNPEYNYFIAFKIDLSETDKNKIDAKIKTVTGSPKGDILTRRLIELKTDAIEIMCNDSVYDAATGKYIPERGGRAKEAADAKAYKLKEAVGVIEILCQTRKTLLKSEVIDICNTANKPIIFFSEAELLNAISYLSGLGVKIIDNIDASIPFSDYQQTEKRLDTLGKKDLYDFLGVQSTSSNSEIQAASDKMYSDSSKTNDLKRKQAISQLCATAKKLLLDSKEARRTYDQYLVLKNDVWSDFEKRKSFGIKEMTMDEYKNYTSTVIALLKVQIDEAERILAIGCKYFQITIVGKTEGNNFEFCPYPDCGKLYIKGAKSCPHCGKPLEVICWNCKQKTPFTKEDKGCPTCGATHRAHDMFNQCCEKIDKLLSRPMVEISDLQSVFLEVKNVVPNYATHADSTVAKKVAEYESVIQSRVRQEETTGAKYKEDVSKIQQMIAKRCYQSALAIAKSLNVKYSTYNIDNSRKLVSDISAVVQNAQRQVDAAKQYLAQGNISLAISTAAKAIDICDDNADARQIMQKIPPQAVTNLRITTEKGKVRLEWDDNAKQEFISYTIIKKIGVAPISAEDGALVDCGLSVKFFEDVNIVSATPYYYAVFVERYGVKSSIAVTSESAIIFADVSNMQQEVVDGGIKVIWEAPQNVKSIDVWKNSGTIAPTRSGEGVRVECSLNGFTDNKCDGQSAYLVICNYDLKGKLVQSRGICAVFKPYEKATPLEDVRIEPIESNRYVFTCATGYAGKVKLYVSNKKLSIPTNTPLKYLDFNSICKGLAQIESSANANGEIIFSLSAGNIFYVYPIVSTEQLFVVSPPRLINTIEGIKKLTHSINNGTVTVSGALHPKAQSIIVRIGHDRYIENIDGGGEKFSYKVEDFSKSGKFEIKLKTDTVNYITIFVAFKEDGNISYSPAIKLEPPIDYREAITVLYSIDYVVSTIKPFKINITFESDKATEIPKLLIMQGYPRPMNKNAGKLCERIDKIVLKKGLLSKKYTAKVSIMVNPAAANMKYALFLNEETNLVHLKEVVKL